MSFTLRRWHCERGAPLYNMLVVTGVEYLLVLRRHRYVDLALSNKEKTDQEPFFGNSPIYHPRSALGLLITEENWIREAFCVWIA